MAVDLLRLISVCGCIIEKRNIPVNLLALAFGG